jgi:uncharacterized protein YggT (Ycf19 family)
LTLIDFILNIVGVLLWLNWRAAAQTARVKPGASLVSTLRPAGPPLPSHQYWAALPVLLAGRALFYWVAAGPAHWIPRLPLGPVTLTFRNDLAGRVFLFSVLSFGAALGIFYLWLLFLSWIDEPAPESDPIQRLIRAWLGRLERLPAAVRMLLPLAVVVASWCLLHALLTWLNMTPPNAVGRLLAQGAVIGLAAYLTLEYLLVALLILYLFNSYVYLGGFPLWNFIDKTVARLLRPWRKIPLHIGKIDLTPVLAIIVVLLAAELARRGLDRLYQRLP